MNSPHDSVLKEIIVDHLNHDSYGLDDLAEWVKTVKVPAGVEEARVFKQELREALGHPGTVTPELYERWTGEELDGQTGVQHRLQEVWDECFGTGEGK